MKRRNQDKDAPFIVSGEPAFKALPHWLRERGRINTYNLGATEKHGYPIINVGYDERRDSDLGKYHWKGGVIVRNRELFDRTESVISEFIENRNSGK